jgi:hypothetical protein
MYLNENPKYIKLISLTNEDFHNMKQPIKDIQKLQKWLRAHQN